MEIDWKADLFKVSPVKKLSEKDVKYQLMICGLFNVFQYYENVFKIDCGDSPFSTLMNCKLFEATNYVSVICVFFPNIRDESETEADFTEHELTLEKDLINEHLAMNCDVFIPSYRYGEYPHQKVCSLYLAHAWCCFELSEFYFYYIDSPYAYRQVEQLKNNKQEIPKI